VTTKMSRGGEVDLDATQESIDRLIRNGVSGVIVLPTVVNTQTPELSFLVSEQAKSVARHSRGDHSVLSHEVRRYSREELRRLVAGAGFTIERLTYTNVSLFLPLAAARLAQRWRGLAREEQVEAQREITVPWWPVNTLLTAALWLEARWVRRFDSPFGSSLVCLARKPGPPCHNLSSLQSCNVTGPSVSSRG